MAFDHHGDSQPPRAGDHLRKLFGTAEQQQSAHKRFREQLDGRAVRKWPEGRLNGDDDGELAFAIGADEQGENVIVDFGKPVEWIGMPPEHAVELAQALIKHARGISKEPLRISLH